MKDKSVQSDEETKKAKSNMKTIILITTTICLATFTQVSGQTTEQYALSDGDSTPLHWNTYVPDSVSYPPPWPVVLVIHVGGFSKGSPLGVRRVCADLASAGFAALAIEYRLDIDANFPGQPAFSPEYSPYDQVSDVKKAISAARYPTAMTPSIFEKVNGKVGAVGGSAGAAHALWCAATGTIGTVDDKFDAAALLSGPYKFDDADSLNNMDSNFRLLVYRYCKTTDLDAERLGHLQSGSPYYQVTTSVSPLFVIASKHDPVTPPQYDDLIGLLGGIPGVDYKSFLMPGNQHAFEYWDTVSMRLKTWLTRRLHQ